MAARLLARQRVRTIATGAVVAGIALFPKSIVHAEAPEELARKKPIYDDLPLLNPRQETLPSSSSSRPENSNNPTRPTPTDRLAREVRKSRLFLHSQLSAAENKLNEFLTSLLHLEHNFTSTVASLAPPPSSGEKLLPGTLYVLVAAMTGSIITRNRNILLRATVPVAMGIGVGWIVLPVTMRNVADLMWVYEKRIPAMAEGHMKARERIERAWTTAKAHSRMTVARAEEKVAEGREAVEGWVRKGR